ncbi:MAG: TonB-dependent receptor [Halioglobus sp.]
MKTRQVMKTLSRSLALLSSAAVVQTVGAQSALEEIVVTAQKREQNLQDVPIAVTAFSGAQMNALGVVESFDIASFSPGVHISGNLAGQNTQFSIRGVTQNDFNDIIEAPNAVYLDEGYIAIAQGQTFAVFDIERVEILKGPQGTLFGRNATGGLVHYISNKPDFENFGGYIDVTAGQFDVENDANRYTVEGAFTGPITDAIAGRLAFRYNEQDAYLENRYPEGIPSEFNADYPFGSGSPGAGAGADLGDDETTAVRGTLGFRPSDNLEIMFAGAWAKTEVATGPYQSKPTTALAKNVDGVYTIVDVVDTARDETRLAIDVDDPTQDPGGDALLGTSAFIPGASVGLPGRLAPGGDFFGYRDPDGDDFTFSGDFAFGNQGDTETSGANLRVFWDMENGLRFTSVTDYKDYEKLLFIDVDSAPVNQLANYAGVDATTFTQEFRLNGETDRMRWVAGLYYLNIDNQSDNGLKAPNGSIFQGVTGAPAIDIGVRADLETNSYSAFGQVDFDLTERLALTAGLRIIQEEKDFDTGIGIFVSQSNFTVNKGDFIPNGGGAGDPYFYDDDTSDTLWTGKLQLDYRPTDDLLLWAGVNRGVKAGSFNAPLLGPYLGVGDSALPYDEEVLLSYEAGFKSTLGDGTTRLNGSIFYYDYEDYQAFLFVGVGGVVINADAETYGAELELQTTPMDGLDFLFNIAAFDSEVQDIPLDFTSPLPPRDVDPTYAPELQATAMARYAWDALGGTMAIQGDVSYSDDFYYNLRNFEADQFDDYTMWNALLSWESAEGNWLVTLAGRNLTDERAGIQGFDLATVCGCNEVSYRAPRFYSVGLRYTF